MSYRKALVFVNDKKAGFIQETAEGYSFEYLNEYLESTHPESVSLTLPLRDEAYHSKTFFPFFDGLIPEGWLLDVVQETWKVNPRDRMGLLLVSCKDTIGNVSIEAL